jgi:chemotaxis protein CheD
MRAHTRSSALAVNRVAARRFLNPQDGCWHVQLTQGETHVTTDPHEVLTTILGSCVSACIRDRVIGAGGMNHFLLPEGGGADRDAMRYGVNAMELLINGLLKLGATRQTLEAKLFGGANVIATMSGVGSRNAAFAERYLKDEGIDLVGGDGPDRRRQAGRARSDRVAAD